MVEPAPHQIEIFDRELLKKRRARAAKEFGRADFLFRWVKDNLRDRLEVIKRDYKHVAQLGGRGGKILEHAVVLDLNTAFDADVICDSEFLPLAPQSQDMIISALDLHSVNDLPGTLLQIKKALKPDGIFIAAAFGGETLHELRACLSTVEMELRGGLSPRVFPFADKQEFGALLQRAGFALPVVDSEILTVTYAHIFKLMDDVRQMGENNVIAARDKSYVGRDFFMRAAKHYADNFSEDDGRIVASFEIVFLIGWAPHESQQKPMKPGSAENRLADALKAEETKL